MLRSRPLTPAAGRARVRNAIVVFALLALAAWRVATLGDLLNEEDPLQKADVILALAGTRLERVAECGDLYREQWAPRIVLSRPERDGGEIGLTRLGIDVISEIDLQRDTLVKMGVPAEAIEAFDAEQAATATESDELHRLASARGWRRIIVVTSKLHTARAGMAIRRRFDGVDVQIIMRGSRYDTMDVERWWTRRASLRFVVFETQKMLAYWIGLAA
jgi:uncharacterized SAM-binding protein YcdF (DUF218 family)